MPQQLDFHERGVTNTKLDANSNENETKNTENRVKILFVGKFRTLAKSFIRPLLT
jgi:hypothetical protein